MSGTVTGLLARADKAVRVGLTAGGRFIVGQIAGLVGFIALPVVAGFSQGMNGTVIFGGLLAGIICGLGAAEAPLAWAAVGGGVAALAGVGVVALASPGLSGGSVLIAVALAAALAYVAAWARRAGFERFVVAAALALLVFAFFWSSGFAGGPFGQALQPLRQQISTEPATEAYGFDGYIFLRTYYLVEGGTPYYEAFSKAYDEDSRLQGPPPTKFGYRQPLLYWMWDLLPGADGTALLFWYAVFACGAMVAGYAIASRFVQPGAALIAPAALLTYFLWPTFATWFTLSEFWAGAVGVACIAALVRRKWLVGAALLVVAVAFRELMVYLVPVFVLAWAAYPERKKEWPALALAVAGALAVLALHLRFAPQNTPAENAFDITPWLNGSWSHMVNALKFSGDLAIGGPSVYLVLALVAAAAALLVGVAWRKVLLFAVVAVPVVALVVFGMNEWEYYWGAIVMPIVLALVPLAFAPFLPAEEAPSPSAPSQRTGGGKPAVGSKQAAPAKKKSGKPKKR